MSNNKKLTGKRSWLSLLCIVAVGIALNLLGTKINAVFELPLYIDSIGTILSALLGGCRTA